LSPSSISLAFVQIVILAPALAAVVIFLWVLAIIQLYVVVIRPIFDWLPRPEGGFLRRAALWPFSKVSGKIDAFVREQVAALSRVAAANVRPFTIILAQNAELVQHVAGTLGDMAEQTYLALYKLNHETIPRKINAALIPVRQTLTRHTDRLDTLEDLNRRVSTAVGDTLRGLPWGVAGTYVGNMERLLASYAHLWEQFFTYTKPQLSECFGETLPALRAQIADLERRVVEGIDARLDALRSDLNALERFVNTTVLSRLDALELALESILFDALGEVGKLLLPLTQRLVALEQWVANVAEPALAALRDDLAQLRRDLEDGIETGLEAFRERIEALEAEVFTAIPQRIAAMQLAIDALAAEIFGEIGAGLAQLTQRIIDIETQIGTIILPAIQLLEDGLEALRRLVLDTVIPRITALEAILEPAAFAALVLATLKVAAPNLFCRNVTDATKRLCATDEDFFAQLLAGTLLFALALDPRLIARAGQEVTEGMAALWRETALR